MIIPGYSEISPSQIDLSTHLTKNIMLKIPIIASPMDAVCEGKMAIAMAQAGGLGIIHKNMTCQKQEEEVRFVKRHEGIVISDPKVVHKQDTIAFVKDLIRQHGFSNFPVIDEQRNVVGILTSKDIQFSRSEEDIVENLMTEDPVCYNPPFLDIKSIEQDIILRMMCDSKIEKVLVVNNKKLVGMITLKDLLRSKNYPNSTVDDLGRLRVGAAIGINDFNRSEVLIDAGVDILCIDTSHGHTKAVVETIRWIEKNYPGTDIIAGNVVTETAGKFLQDNGASAIKVGLGSGSICTTRIIAGIGVPQITALQDVSSVVSIPVICDGGIRYSGDIVKALVYSDVAMLGNLLSGTDESPGETELYQGRKYKLYRGMGSLAAMKQGSSSRYYQSDVEHKKLVPEGIEGRVPYRGSVEDVLYQLVGGIKAGFAYSGAKDIITFQTTAQLIKITQSGILESHPHDVSIVRESPNYSIL